MTGRTAALDGNASTFLSRVSYNNSFIETAQDRSGHRTISVEVEQLAVVVRWYTKLLILVTVLLSVVLMCSKYIGDCIYK